MANDYTLWRHDLLQALPARHRVSAHRLHRGGAGHGSSFREAIRRLYTDCQLEKFVSLRAWQQAGLTERMKQQRQALKRLLDDDQEPDTDAEILADPGWHATLHKTPRIPGMINE